MPYRSGCGSVAGAILALMAGTLLVGPASAQTGEPIKIGFSMALTGGLAPNGKSALLAQKLWEEDVNAKGRAARPAGEARLLRRQELAGGSAGDLHQAARRRQGRACRRTLCDGADRASDADRDAEEEDVHWPAGARGQHRVQLSELLRHDPVRSGRQAGVHQGFFRRCHGAGREAADGGHRGGGPGVLPQCRRWCARECQGGEPARGL